MTAKQASPHALIAAVHYWPEATGGVPRILLVEDFLRRAGWQVTIVTPQPVAEGRRGATILRVPPPRYVSLAQKGDRSNFACEKGDKSHFAAKIGLIPFFKGVARRWLFFPDTYIGWAVRAARAAGQLARTAPPQLVITTSPQESTHWLGWRLKRALGCRWLADFRDGWTFEPHRAEAAMFGRHALERCCERRVVAHADWTTAATAPIADDLRARYPAQAEKILYLPTGFEECTVKAAARDDKRFRMVYTGRFGLSQPLRCPDVFFAGLRQALEASPELRQKFRLTLVGAYRPRERDLWCEAPVADCVEELSERSYEEAVAISASADMLLLVTPPGLRSIATRKLFDYLAVRQPIFALAEANEAARILAETRAGYCVSPAAPAAVREGLLRAFAAWQSGTLAEMAPCSGNELYRAETHLKRVLGRVLQSL
jgi:hypothetical protein